MLITTSWDDGHPNDLRLAEMLGAFGIAATFYIPRASVYARMTGADLRRLAQDFDIGAHTLTHAELPSLPDAVAREEIAGSRKWIADVTGREPPMFCPPRGRFTARHARLASEAGFTGLRTVEMMSTDRPRFKDGLVQMATTLQAFPHGVLPVARNLLKRRAWRGLVTYLRIGPGADWTRQARRSIATALQRDGVFHLWGHSWEFETEEDWQCLHAVLHLLAGTGARSATNSEICRRVSCAF